MSPKSSLTPINTNFHQKWDPFWNQSHKFWTISFFNFEISNANFKNFGLNLIKFCLLTTNLWKNLKYDTPVYRAVNSHALSVSPTPGHYISHQACIISRMNAKHPAKHIKFIYAQFDGSRRKKNCKILFFFFFLCFGSSSQAIPLKNNYCYTTRLILRAFQQPWVTTTIPSGLQFCSLCTSDLKSA